MELSSQISAGYLLHTHQLEPDIPQPVAQLIPVDGEARGPSSARLYVGEDQQDSGKKDDVEQVDARFKRLAIRQKSRSRNSTKVRGMIVSE